MTPTTLRTRATATLSAAVRFGRAFASTMSSRIGRKGIHALAPFGERFVRLIDGIEVLQRELDCGETTT